MKSLALVIQSTGGRPVISRWYSMQCSIVSLWCTEPQEVQNELQSNSHACFGQRQTMETGRDQNNFQLCLTVFSSISDLSLVVALALWATECLALHQTHKRLLYISEKNSRMFVKLINNVLEIEF